MDTEKIINRGVAFIAKEQQKNGSFLCLTTTKENDFGRARFVPAIVPSNIVLSCLNALEETATVHKIKNKVARFLLSQKSEYWSFNYWFRNSPESRKLPYPDDLDDTFCALAALHIYDPSIVDGAALGKIATMLTAAEEREGGPYDMWLTRPEDKEWWKRIDLVVNSNVAYFLSLNEVTLPRVTKFIETSIDQEDYIFPYCSIYPAIYFISRFYRGEKMLKMVDKILTQQKEDGSWGNPLQTALAILSLCNFSAKVPSAVMQKGFDYLARTQKKNGSWGPYAFYIELQTKEKNYYAGSAALTTALCIEAISKSGVKSQKSKVEDKSRDQGKSHDVLYKKIVKSARARFAMPGNDLQKQFKVALKRVLKMDKNKHIILLPYLFFESLSLEEQRKLQNRDKILADLCLANLYGWIAYTIYDDILDGDGDPKLLSVANVCLREITRIYEQVTPEHPEVAVAFHEVLDAIDSANTWETSHCRDKSFKKIPDYGDLAPLANRSLGHALGPTTLLLMIGYKKTSAEMCGLRDFFEHYLIARQLNDDAHDWEDDLKKGAINAIGAQLLKKAPKHMITQAKEQGDFIPLESLFWKSTIDAVCKDVATHTRRARKSLEGFAHCIADGTLFTTMLAGPEAMIAKTKKEKVETVKFLKSF